MHRIAVLSDTHGLLREEVLEKLVNCDAILHAGDIGKPAILDRLRQIAPLYAVRGNIDREKWADEVLEEMYIELYGFNIYMVHNKKYINQAVYKPGQNINTSFFSGTSAGIIITGHSHRYEAGYKGDIYFLNPGSCGPKRFRLAVTMAFLVLDEKGHSFSVEKTDFTDILKKGKPVAKKQQKDLHHLVKEVIKEMDAGKGVSYIAKKNGADEELVEQICRIYSTHPGVDIDGILNRMEIWNL